MKIKWRQWKIIMTAVLGALLLTGCGLLSKENVKLRDLDFTVLSEEKIPEELKTVIAEKGTEPFQLTYSDNQNTHFFRFLSLSHRSISRWQTPTQG